MKRIIILTLAIFVLLGSVSVFALDSYYPDYEIIAADEFRAIGLPITNLENPADKLQNMMDIEFVHGREIYRKYVSGDYADGTVDLGKSSIELFLTYDKNKLENKEKVFITGTFIYTQSNDNGTFTAKGDVQGTLVYLQTNLSVFNFGTSSEDDFSLVLACYAENPNWVRSFILTSPDDSAASVTQRDLTSQDTETLSANSQTAETTEKSNDTIVYRFDDSYFSHEEKPHLPGVSKQWDVAAGVGLTTAGIVIVNTLTNSSVFGSASFNGSFNPQASPSVQPGTGSGAASGSTGSSASTGLSGTSAGMTSAASTAQGATASSLSQGAQASAGGSNLIKGISDFFKGLFEALRDMLTDEGRSYASGKITDLLSETDLTNLGDKE